MTRLALVALCSTLSALAQRTAAELRLTVLDPAGLPLEASGELSSRSTQWSQRFTTDTRGRWTARGVPRGVYLLSIARPGFTAHSATVELFTEVPVERRITLGVAPLETSVVIRDDATLIDPSQPGFVNAVGKQSLAARRSTDPSRAVLDQVQTQPGWLLEANGVLHPRGAEYGTQYIVDGIPIQDNRSPGFAPALEADDLEGLRVFTASFPAEYGRKLGGVVEIDSPRDLRQGVHGSLTLQAGSFDARHAYASVQITRGKTTAAAGGQGWTTDRFLDPPDEQNFTNHGSAAGAQVRLEHDLSDRDRLRVAIYERTVGFLVPNELAQQQAGQRQDRRSAETMGLASWQHVFSPRLVGNVRGMVRDVDARLWSNALATPIEAQQDRGFRESYVSASASYVRGAHEFKAGVETIHSRVRETFAYRITDPTPFDGDIPERFAFSDRASGSEQAVFAQDVFRWRALTVSAGLRYDRYRLLIRDSAISPRLGLAYHAAPLGLVLRASYDRAFQTPAIENLLLASLPQAQRLTDETLGLPVPTSRGDFFQAGFSKSLGPKLRLDAAWFRRNIGNYADDDVFLNTGVSFPVSFARAWISGYEVKLDLPRWGRVTASASYSNLIGRGRLPLTGGLFLEEGSEELLNSNAVFAITQDQRNTVAARVRVEAAPRLSFAIGAWYASGLPFEAGEDFDLDDIHPRILNRVNLDRGRVRPSHSFDASATVDLIRRDRFLARVQADVLNLTNQFNVINFAGIFSGNALAAPRTGAVRLRVEF